MDQFSTILQGTHGFQEGHLWDFLGGSVVKNLPDNAGNMGSIPDPGGSHMPQSDWACAPQLLSFCSRDLTEAKEIKKKWQEYTEELYKEGLNDTDNHDGVVTHLESDILECEIKWALETIATNKAGGGDGIPAELFKTLKDDAVKILHSLCQQIWRTQQWPQD